MQLPCMRTWPVTDVIALSLIGKITNSQRIALVERHDSLTEALAELGALELDLRERASRVVAEAEANQTQIFTYWQAPYPTRLRALEQPPPVIYVLGTIPSATQPSVAMVGTRSCTVSYGKPVTDMLVKQFVQHGCAIVSGLAKGIDMLGHEACLRAGGTTVAVIASGTARISPLPAQQMATRITNNGGAIISEHPPTVRALPPYFAARNRIIAAMSDAVVVVESKIKGGALITAEFASRQGKTVWAVPGMITATRSVGTNELIASGRARLLASAADLLESLDTGWFVGREPTVSTSAFSDEFGPEPITVSQAALIWQCSVQEAMVRLFDLEMEGCVQQLPGARYVAM